METFLTLLPLILHLLDLSLEGVVGSEVSPISTPTKEYCSLALKGFSKAKCLHQTKGLPVLDEESRLFTIGATCGESHSCIHCIQAIENEGEMSCSENSDVGCCSQINANRRNQLLTPEHEILFHCSDWRSESRTFDAYFRIQFIKHEETLRNLTKINSTSFPTQFLVELEIQHVESGNEKKFFLTSDWLISVNVPTDTSFRLGVSPISVSGIHSSVYSEYLLFSPNDQRGVRKPRDLEKVRIRQNPFVLDYADIQVLVHWKSGMGSEATCRADVSILEKTHHFFSFTQAQEIFWFNLTKGTNGGEVIALGKNYTIHIKEVSDVKDDFSNGSIIYVQTPPCLQFFNYNFTFCPPPPPRDVRFEILSNSSLLVSWIPPIRSSRLNPIESYTVRLIQFNPGSTNPISPSGGPSIPGPVEIANITLPGTETSYRFDQISPTGLYQLSVRAFSKAGGSTIARVGPIAKEVFVHSLVYNCLLVGMVLFCFILIPVSYYIFTVRKRKEDRKKARAKYFEDEGEEKWSSESPYFPPYCSTWLIDSDCLKIGNLIGKGNFGEVHAATLYKWKSSKIVAVKTLKGGVDLSEKSKFWEEFKILKDLEPHPHVLRLIGIVKSHHPTIVVEYCDGGDLRKYLTELRDEKAKKIAREERRLNLMRGEANSEGKHTKMVTNEEYFCSDSSIEAGTGALEMDTIELYQFLSFARQVAVGMEFLSNNKVIHRDLAARNILVATGPKPILKIGDFGLSRDIYERNWYKKSSDDEIPVKWLALESLQDEVYTRKSDIWSYGVLLWEIVTYGGNPYPGIQNKDIFEYLKMGFRMSQPDGCPLDLYFLMRRCWEKEPEQRPEFGDIRQFLDYLAEDIERGEYFRTQGICVEDWTSIEETRVDLHCQIPKLGRYSLLVPTKPSTDATSYSETHCTENVLYTE